MTFALGEELPQSNVRVRDVVLPGRQHLQLISLLEDRAIVRRDVEEGGHDVLLSRRPVACPRAHLHFMGVTQNGLSGLMNPDVSSEHV